MEAKSFKTLELDKILARLAGYADFSASRELLEALEPTPNLDEARRRQQETSEACRLLDEHSGVTIGGARDVREAVSAAERGRTLAAKQFIDIKITLESAIRLRNLLGRTEEAYPLLETIAEALYEGKALIHTIGRTVDENGEVLDSASGKLANIRRDLRQTQDRLRAQLNSILNNSRNAPYLQDAIITTRGGRYVIPVKAEARGRLDGIVHDQSSSGATLFIEPVATVPTNNRIRELELAERDEILRILQALSDEVAQEADPIIYTVEAIAELDAAFSRAKLSFAMNAAAPTLVGFEEGATLHLIDARHPLIPPDEVIAIDVMMEDVTQLIITGPNTGGKTVSLKNVGLMVLMAQCGLHIPASAETVLTVFEEVFADIGDEQSIEQSLSTFSAHMTNIISILERADERSLVIIDELGSGTDPTEGAALARAILEYLRERSITNLTATHYPELKLYAHSTPGVRNASMEFDVDTLSPTYRLTLGLPGRSNALAIASRLGLSGEIIELARSFVGDTELSADNMLNELDRTRRAMAEAHERLALEEEDLKEQNRKLRARLERIEEERQRIIAEARAQAEDELDELRREMADMRRRLQEAKPRKEKHTPEIDALEEEADLVERTLKRPVTPVVVPTVPKKKRLTSEAVASPTRELQAGDRVYVPDLNAEGEVLSVDDDVEVQVGVLRVRVEPDELEYRGSGQQEAEVEVATFKAPKPKSPGLELDMRGMRVEEGMLALDEYLDKAYLAGLPWARILHGKGSGALRKAVRELLRGHELVKEYKSAPRHEGGEGVTLVYFAEMM